MDAKITLKFDQQVVENAKLYAKKQNRSLSRIIESYLQSLTNDSVNKDKTEIIISDFVKNMTSKNGVSSDLDYKKEYSNHISEKYK
jgi:Family of unknown function (DUF6364)